MPSYKSQEIERGVTLCHKFLTSVPIPQKWKFQNWWTRTRLPYQNSLTPGITRKFLRLSQKLNSWLVRIQIFSLNPRIKLEFSSCEPDQGDFINYWGGEITIFSDKLISFYERCFSYWNVMSWVSFRMEFLYPKFQGGEAFWALQEWNLTVLNGLEFHEIVITIQGVS